VDLEEAAKIAGLLRARQIGAGDRVGLRMGDLAQFSATFHGILRVGAVVVLIDPLTPDAEVEQILNEAGAQLVFDEPSARLAGHTPDYAITPCAGADPAVVAGRVTLTHDDLGDAATMTRDEVLALIAEKDSES
jgi:acyl-CoA synthetase (AMP-forming)/AMP-acid ligase II